MAALGGMPILRFAFWHAPLTPLDHLDRHRGHANFHFFNFGMPRQLLQTISSALGGMPILRFTFWHAPSPPLGHLGLSRGHAYFTFRILACPVPPYRPSAPIPHTTKGHAKACPLIWITIVNFIHIVFEKVDSCLVLSL